MENKNSTVIVDVKNEALQHFCEKKLHVYKLILKSSLKSGDQRKLKLISEELANDLFTVGAIELNVTVMKLFKVLCNPNANQEEIARKLTTILKLVKALKNDYKDYLNTRHVYKKINIVSAGTNSLCCENEENNDFCIEEEFVNQWKCTVQ